MRKDKHKWKNSLWIEIHSFIRIFFFLYWPTNWNVCYLPGYSCVLFICSFDCTLNSNEWLRMKVGPVNYQFFSLTKRKKGKHKFSLNNRFVLFQYFFFHFVPFSNIFYILFLLCISFSQGPLSISTIQAIFIQIVGLKKSISIQHAVNFHLYMRVAYVCMLITRVRRACALNTFTSTGKYWIVISHLYF